MTIDAGTQLGYYTILSLIGVGGMGQVYLAEDTRLGRKVALKLLLPEVAKDGDRVRRFIQEARSASALNHPNIVTIYEFGEFADSRYIATELIAGRTLRERLDHEPLSLGETLDAAIQIAAALNAANAEGIIHRDIKPENIMLRADGVIKILDFGLAKLTEKGTVATSARDATTALVNTLPGTLMGTATYMSPEQARGIPADSRTDIWSLGVVLFELLTGQTPFKGDGAMDTISSILKDTAPSLCSIAPQLPKQLERIVDKTLRKDREHRYQHIKDLFIDLEDIRDELKLEAKLGQSSEALRPAPSSPTTVVSPGDTKEGRFSRANITSTQILRERRFTLVHAIGFVVLAGVLATGGWWYLGRNAPTDRQGVYKVTDVATWNSAPGELFSSATFSPDGRMIAFSSTKTNNTSIWVKQTGSTDAIKVTKDDFAAKDPIWSPKGDEVAFFSEKGNGSGGETTTGVWRISALGTGEPRSVGMIADGSSELREWTEKGNICFQSHGELYALDLDSGATKRLTSLEQKYGSISWIDISPDEQRIAFLAKAADKSVIYISDLLAKNPTRVVETKEEVNGVAWLPDKSSFYYSSSVDGIFQVFGLAGAAKNPRQLTSTETDNIVVDASPDGGAILFSSAREESNIWKVLTSRNEESAVTRAPDSEFWPSVAPDNSKIAFQSVKNLSRGRHIFDGSISSRSLLTSVDGVNSQTLVEHGALPVWSPDGTSVAFLKNSSGVFDLMTTNANGGNERHLASGGIAPIGYSVSPYNTLQSTAIAWKPNGSSVAYISDRSGAPNIWEASVADGSDTQITDNSDANTAFYCPMWSSDGKRLAYFTQSRTKKNEGQPSRALSVLDLASRRSVTPFSTEAQFRLIGWNADETALIIAISDKFSSLPPETSLRSISVATGTQSDIVRINSCYYYNIFLSDDRRSIAFAARQNDKDDIWVVPASGGSPRRLTNNNDSSQYFSRLAWLHDGSAIVFGKQSRFSMLSMLNNID